MFGGSGSGAVIFYCYSVSEFLAVSGRSESGSLNYKQYLNLRVKMAEGWKVINLNMINLERMVDVGINFSEIG